MLIKNAKKSEPWEVESFWEWIPSEKRKIQANQDILDSNVLPFEKLYTRHQSKSGERDPLTQEEKNLRQTLNIQQWNPNSPHSKDRPLSAKIGSTQANKKTLTNNFMKDTKTNIFANPQSQTQQLGEVKPLTNKQKKKIEEEKRKYDEFRKYQTEIEAKDRNRNLLYFNARFPHLKVDEYYKIQNGWEKTPLIEELPQSPPRGRVPNDLIGQTHVEGNKITQKIVFYKEDKNEGISSIQDGEEEDNYQRDVQAAEQVEPIPQAHQKQSSQGGSQANFTNKKLQEQRESAKIQLEINKLLSKKNQIQPKTGKEAFGVHRKREINSFLDMRKMMKVSNKVDAMFKNIKDRGFPGGMEFADDHLDEMHEIKDKLENRSVNLSLERELDEMEYDQGKLYDDIQNRKKKGKKKSNNDDQEEEVRSQQYDDNNDIDLFGAEQVDEGDQAVGAADRIQQRVLVKKTTFLTQEKVEAVPAKVAKTKDNKLKSKKAQEMEDLMNEIDLGDDELLEDYDQEMAQANNQNANKEKEQHNLSDSLEEMPKSKPKAKKEKFESKRVQFFNGKVIRKPKTADEQLEDELEEQKQKNSEKAESKNKSKSGKDNIENEDQEDAQSMKQSVNEDAQSDKKSQNLEQSVKSKGKQVVQNETFDFGEEKKQLWQKEVLIGNHRAYLDDKQNFDYQKFVQDVDEETRDKCKDKVKDDIKKLEERTQKKIDQIKGGSTYKRSQMLKEKSEKLDKINSKFQKSLQSIKDTLEQSKKESATIERKPSAQKLLEKAATKILKDTQKNTDSQKRLKIDNAAVNEIKKHEFKFSQKEKINDEEPHPWL